MLNILPRVTGLFVAHHLKISYSAALDLGDMREVLDKVRTVAENYQRPRQPWWAVVPDDQYSFTKFL